MTLGRLAELSGARLVGDPALPVKRALTPGSAKPESDDLLIAFAPQAYAALAGSGARIALIGESQEVPASLVGCLVSPRPRVAFAFVLQAFEIAPHLPAGVHPTALVDPTAKLGAGVALGPYVVVGPRASLGTGCRVLSHVSIGADAVIGEAGLIHAGVRIGERVQIGQRVVVQPGAVIGGDGFSFVTPQTSSMEAAKPRLWEVTVRNDEIFRIPSLGTVIIGDDVEIGANTTIDRATLGATLIGNSTKIDNQVQVAHNTRIGENALIAAQVGLAGSVVVGDRAVLGGQVGIADHRKIGADAIVMGGAGVAEDIPAAEVYGMSPAVRIDKAWDNVLNVNRIGRMIRQLLDLERRLTEMERKAAQGQKPGAGQQEAET